LIKSIVKVHDRTQLQVMFDYLLPTDASLASKKYHRYKIDLFLFYPPQMHVTKQNYSKSLFYSDLRTLTRLQEPRWGCSQFLSTNPQSPLYKIERILEQDTRTPQEVRKIIEHIRSYCCLYAGYLSRKKRKRQKWLRYQEGPQESEGEGDTCQTLKKGLIVLRALIEMEQAALRTELIEAEIEAEFSVAVEYCFFLFQKMVASFFLELESAPWDQGVASPFKKTRAYVRLCYWIALRRKYPLLTQDSPQEELELFANRHRSLKQRMEQPLYVKLETPRFFLFRKQLGSMVAAGAAATWTLVINLLIFTQLRFTFQTLSFRNPDGVIGLSTLLILLSFILAYIMQDRIKELGRSRFTQGVSGELPDHQERMWSGAGKSRVYVGIFTETCNFIRYDNPHIRDIQKKRATGAGGMGLHQESVLHYEREVALSCALSEQISAPVTGLRDNIRLNMKQFLPKLDEPYYHTPYVGAQGQVSMLQMPKNYQLDLVWVVSEVGVPSSGDMQPQSKRLILNKEGLLRVEDV
jgi:hypothetical protein